MRTAIEGGGGDRSMAISTRRVNEAYITSTSSLCVFIAPSPVIPHLSDTGFQNTYLIHLTSKHLIFI